MRNDPNTLSRRGFLHRLSFAGAAAAFFTGCRIDRASETGATTTAIPSGGVEAISCTDDSGLTEEQKQIRRSLKYTDHSPHEDKRCNNCQAFKAPTGGQQCGGCTVVPGPIHPQGYCTAWTAAA